MPTAVTVMPSDVFGLSQAWRGKHWHAYLETGRAERSVARWQRLQCDPDAVLESPDAVAEWIEQQILELGGTCKVMAVADRQWVEINDADDLAHLFGEHVVIASRGDSIFTDIYHPDQRIELYVEAVSVDDCDHN